MPVLVDCLDRGPGCLGIADPGKSRCHPCYLAQQRKRNAKPERAIYGGRWQAVSRTARTRQPWCSNCGASDDLTLDHTTSMVFCRACHRPEAQGGARMERPPSHREGQGPW